MNSRPLTVASDNLSIAWGRAFLALLEPGVSDLIPLIVTLSGFQNGAPSEVPEIRLVLDEHLASNSRKFCQTATTANLIFPENLWHLHRHRGRATFFHRYLDVIFPRIQRADRRNADGTYFQRLLAYGPARVNQLAHLIDTRLQGNLRRSALQAVIFDPTRDHKRSPYMNFPCLDYVAFAPDPTGGLSLTAFYANQYLFDRAYGNYLGLCALGRFVAEELGLEFRRLTCVAGIAQVGSIRNKATARLIGTQIAAALGDGVSASTT